MMRLDGYTGTRENQHLAFADGGLPEVMRWLEATPRVGYHNNGGPRDAPSEFNDHSTWQDALDMARNGWSEGAARIARGFTPPTFGASSRKPRWGFDVAGDLPDVGRYLSGHPDAMRRRKADKGRQPVVVLYIANGVRANITTKEYRNFGQAVCEMIDALENAGTRVELNQLTRTDSGQVTGWRVKEATDPLDLSAIAFTYMHPAAHRRLQFQMRNRIGDGYVGGSSRIAAKDFPDAPQDALFVEGVSMAGGYCNTLAGAREFFRNRVNKAAGHELITPEMIEHLSAA